MAVKNPNPMHPGQVLETVYMEAMKVNQSELAAMIGCAPRKVNEIVNGKRGISPDFALDLEQALGTTADMWVNLQAAYDLAVARHARETA